ncbi:hypothetical protein GR160_12330 [Flavobacterium sp. Sd200]|uniref:hypothetical protein n=1 Tax=Flavobacterium sp. Sd200 TaxID=2692211 RepID=UPI00136BF234|nr:hypothetical protein [Flavobacterium sp. Sd200]MXN92013.1 hypothetical protein [Flavobacterium sp. Sd200]
MSTSRHIFLQIDTDSIIAIAESLQLTDYSFGDIRCEEVLEHTLIYNQGGMALGNAVEDFATIVEEGDLITVTILPLKLFSNHMLTFVEFVPEPHPYAVLEVQDPKSKVSFDVNVARVVQECSVKFNLKILLRKIKGDAVTEIPLCIDPVLRVRQGRG